MNVSSRTAAGRSRSADEDAFLRPHVGHPTGSARSAPPAASPHAWKRGLQEKIWSTNGPKGLAARSILTLLLWHADAQGRVWLGIQAIANKTGAGSLRTVRHALAALAREGWLQSTAQTWASLRTEQTAAGRPVPRRGDVGQAPNLYVLLDGSGLVASSREVHKPLPNDPWGPLQKCTGVPLANPLHDPDPIRSRSRIKSAEPATPVHQNTHIFPKVHGDGSARLDTWRLIVEAHTTKTKQVYGLPPLPPDLKRAEQRVLAECLAGAAVELRAQLHDRTGEAHDVHDVQRELATRVMQLYFKRDNEHLRRVKHALRDLPREFHARITEAMQLLLRERHDARKPRQMPSEREFVATNKPMERTTPAQPEVAHANTAREARRLLEALSATPASQEHATRSSVDHDKPTVPDKPKPEAPVAARTGAPRWGSLGPRPVKIRKPPYASSDGVDEYVVEAKRATRRT